MNNTEKIICEIEEFHGNIEKWFQGKPKIRESLYQELLAGFSQDFKMINGNGDTVTLSMLEEWLPTVFGKFPGAEAFRLKILKSIILRITDLLPILKHRSLEKS